MNPEAQNEVDSAAAEAPAVPANVQPMPMPTVQQVGLGSVLDVKDKDGKVIGHYQWATHKDGKMDSLVVVKVLKSEDGTEQVLYKTYTESAIAKKVMEDAVGSVGVQENLSKVRLGETYKAHNGDISTYGIKELLSFQSLGFILVLCVLAGLWAVISVVSYIVKAFGFAEQANPSQSKPAAVSASGAKTIHPGMSDEKFIAIISAAAAHAFGGAQVSVVKFKPLNTMDWTWAIQGRVSLHTHKV
ncbi:MAG: OadG family protein [Fibromonadaceae bacterium]|jgi:Na+-transporting methylmalonyl-CoA/oxaloacetate decarboxylase gamma subunit|nr:OadG family protein [Fibromonadaceae bacterium]